MERKYQVFISSTFEDLMEERKEVIQALLEMDCIPTGMEMFQASDDSQWELIKNVISSCDYYIVIIAGRYGSVHPITQKSYTQMEYEYASMIGIPIIAFLYNNIENLPLNKIEQKRKNQKKLQQFRELTQNKMVKFWSNKSELASAVSRSMYKIFKTHPQNGWVRSDNIDINNTIISTINSIEKVSNKSINSIFIDDDSLDKYFYYLKYIEDVENNFELKRKLILGKFHIDFLKEFSHIILTAGIDRLADFFKFSLEPDYTTKLYFADKLGLEKILVYTKNSYFTEFDCTLPGYILINFHNKIIEKVNCFYDDLEIFPLNKIEFVMNALYELGSIFVGGSLVNLSKLVKQKISPLNFGFNENIFEYVTFENNAKYLVFKLSVSNNTDYEYYVETFYIIDFKYINVIFSLFNLNIKLIQ